MKVLIDISEDDFIKAKEDSKTHLLDRIWSAVANGTPLPEGHGDLIDSNELKTAMFAYMKDKNKTHEAKYVMSVAKGIVDLQKPIIEAESKERINENI